MANKQIHQLTALSTPSGGDVLPIQDQSGVAEAKKISVNALQSAMKDMETTVTAFTHGFSVGMAVHKDSSGAWTRSQAVGTSNLSYVDYIVSAVPSPNSFKVAKVGDTFDTTGLGLTANTVYYLASTPSGVNYTATAPTTNGEIYKELFRTNTANQATVINAPGYEITAAAGGGGLSFSEDLVPRIIKTGSVAQGSEAAINFATEVAGYTAVEIEVRLSSFTNGGGQRFQLSADGTNFISSGYRWVYQRTNSAATNGGDSSIQLSDWAAGIQDGMFIRIRIENPNTANQFPVVVTASGEYGDGNPTLIWTTAVMSTATTVKGIKFWNNNGDVAIPYYRIIGYKN